MEEKKAPQQMKTYVEQAQELFNKEPGFYDDFTAKDAMLSFAKYLDQNYNSVDLQLQNMVLLSAFNFEQECSRALLSALGAERATEILRPIVAKHRHKKVFVEDSSKTV